MPLLRPHERFRASSLKWEPGDWLHLRNPTRGKYHNSEWAIFDEGWVDLVQLVMPHGFVTWGRHRAEVTYTKGKFGYRRARDRPRPDWMIPGLRLAPRFQHPSTRPVVYRVAEIRGHWAKIEEADAIPTEGFVPFKIQHLNEVLYEYTPYLNRFQRELDL